MFNKTVDSILSQFTKTVKELETHVERKGNEIAVYEQAAEAAMQMRDSASTEVKKAKAAITKLNNIFKD